MGIAITWLRRAALFLFWPGVALVAWGELTPDPPHFADQIFGWDKAEHFTAYFGLAGMVVLALGFSRRLPWALLAVLALGGTLEVLQNYTGRDSDWYDMLANTLGWTAGIVIGSIILLVARKLRLVDALPAD